MTVPAAKRPLSSRPIRDAPELRRELLVASAAYSSRLAGIIVSYECPATAEM